MVSFWRKLFAAEENSDKKMSAEKMVQRKCFRPLIFYLKLFLLVPTRKFLKFMLKKAKAELFFLDIKVAGETLIVYAFLYMQRSAPKAL
jgi:hypothetical protein